MASTPYRLHLTATPYRLHHYRLLGLQLTLQRSDGWLKEKRLGGLRLAACPRLLRQALYATTFVVALRTCEYGTTSCNDTNRARFQRWSKKATALVSELAAAQSPSGSTGHPIAIDRN